ncbi:unnamed protein product [Hymenolepis diminuta]|uniref:Dynein regulatory complex subunit 2 n=2 Tax=Hymenolepis diminuta TaxID=6216 RepID=A0A0R3SMP1_HYMDI|nr:unnamed protein product [Hymenolepis diminuta]
MSRTIMKKGNIKTDENNEPKLEKQRLAAAAAAKKKKDLLHKYLKNKLENEEKMSKINSLTLDHQWRLILRKAKTEEIKKDIEILRSTFERINDRKDDVLQTLVLNLAQSEEQYMMALRGHLQSLDSFVDIQNERLEKMKHSFDTELSMMKREYEAEKAYMINRHRQQIDELKDIYVAFDRYILQKEQTARSEYGNIRDGMKNKLIEDKHALRMRLEKKVESIWAEFNNLRTSYLKSTEERRTYYDDLQKRNVQEMKDIANQVSLIQTLTDAIAAEKARINSLNDEFTEKNRLLREEVESLSSQLMDLKKMVNRLKDQQRYKLTKMLKISNNVQKSLAEMVKEVNIIIGLGEICRQFECKEEKIWPFPASCLSQEDESLLKENEEALVNKEFESIQKAYEPLDMFWRRFSKVQLDKLALLKERQMLEKENLYLKSAIAQYLENLSVNEKVMSQPNNLFIVNGKRSLV